MHKKFNHTEIEKKWQTQWSESGIYATDDTSAKPKQYILDMFPYPSGEGLHVGHPKGYIATDIYSRFKKMSGFEVLHPMGWDAFGLPAENYAIKNKVHPREAVEKNIANFKAQLAKLGFNYDWSKEINTTDPEYYKWTQWIFLKLLEKGLAYESYEPINWCPSCQTGLANEDLESDGTCERCGSVVEKKPMRQWVLKITDYADRMLADLDTLKKWPQHVKEAQRQWIGKSDGAEFDFKLSLGNGTPTSLTVFTTRPDTLFGATFVAISAELANAWIKNGWNASHEILSFVAQLNNEPMAKNHSIEKEMKGFFTGVYATNPATCEEIPVWIANYVLNGVGTGAIMGVPAHDERDFVFANHPSRDIKMKEVVVPLIPLNDEFYKRVGIDKKAYVGTGTLIDSEEFTGMTSKEAEEAIVKKVGGRMKSTYRLKDWVFSRQRYWGEPIPVVHCETCGVVPIPYEQLPVTLPEVDNYAPTGTGESPLADITEWVNTTCPKCTAPAKRETNTMPQWAGSSWYYLRFIDPHNDASLVDPEKEKKWAPVDVYVGGDHAVRHLIYARFWHKFLYDIGAVHTIEPFERLEFLGFILAPDGRKMSKRWGNVINPDDIVATNGADTLRVYEMFMGPFENTVAWSTDSLVGAQRFLERVNGLDAHIVESDTEETLQILHRTIQKVSEDIEAFKFNTAISSLMICINHAEKMGLSKDSYLHFLKLLAPFAPHLTEELWERVGGKGSIHQASWPAVNPTFLVSDTIKVSVQFNGKMRGLIEVSSGATEEDVLSAVRSDEGLSAKLVGIPKRVIYVQDKIINIVL